MKRVLAEIVVVVLILFCAGLLLVTWPIAPFVLYRSRKKENAEAVKKERDRALVDMLKREDIGVNRERRAWGGAEL